MTRRMLVGGLLVLAAVGCGAAQNRAGGFGGYADRIGIGLEGTGGRGLEFVDVMRTARQWEAVNGGKVPLDARGWPTADARTVAFDLRPTFAWAPPMDDPDQYQIDVSGTYKLSFTGRATVAPGDDPHSFTVTNLKYDPAANRTTADVTVPKGQGLSILNFTQTTGGVRDVRLIRPGYPADTKQVFHTPFLKALQPFPVLRFMDWLETNNSNPFYGDPAPHNVTQWSERRLPEERLQRAGDKRGIAWEYVIDLANETGKDIWINIPVSATDEYVASLAELFRTRLNGKSAVYVEHSNEVWNWGFLQATYNRMAAEAEVKAGSSSLNNDGEKSWDVWRRRRHAKRTIEIGQAFAKAFGPGSLNTRIRPVLSWWAIFPEQYGDMLEWVRRTYGEPKQHLYAIAMAPYFNSEKAGPNASVEEILQVMRASSDGWRPKRQQFIDLAKQYGLKPMCYEGGPDSGGGSAVNVGNRIRAHRSPVMRELVLRDMRDNWFALGGDLFMYFTLTSAYSRYGCWGLTDDVTRTDTPKFRAVKELMGSPVAAR